VARNPELEAAILADPDAIGGYQVYGDWLQAHGDPRGELIALQTRQLERDANKFIASHPELWAGLEDRLDFLGDVKWRLGFVERARVAYPRERYWKPNKRGQPVFVARDVPEVIGALLDGAGRFLRDLTVGIATFEDNSYEQVVEAMWERRPLVVRSLFLGDFVSEETELNWSTIGEIGKLWEAAPRLRSLHLRSGSMYLGKIVAPELRSLEIYTGGLPDEAITSIANATWPEIETLDVMFGRDSSGNEVRELGPLLAARGVPKLRRLGIKNFEFHADLVAALPGAAVLRQLEVLDLSMGTLGDEEAARLAAAGSAFAHLKELIVDDNMLSDEGLAALGRIGCPITSHGQRRMEDGDRYASVYE
jgi:uncharacterized protein (TIGR02996 family)